MADRGVCRGKVLVLGHSFVRRLQTFLGNDQIQLYGHRVTFCGIGGATVGTLRAKLSRMNVTDFCIVYVEIGTNDLCISSGETVAADISSLIAYLRTHGITQVILGEILSRSKQWVRGPSLEEFAMQVRQVNTTMMAWTCQRRNVSFWKHRRLHSPGLLHRDGVHLNRRGMHLYWRSVRGALVKHLRHACC